MSNSLRSNSAIFMLNTKSQSLSTFTNLFRLPPPGYTHPASNILHKLTHQPLWKHASGLPPPLHKLNLKFHMIITTTHSHVFSVADKGESEGEQRPSQL